MIHRDLHRLETYAIGTTAIVGTASFAIALSDGDKDDHVVMLNLAALAAGAMTITAYTIDIVIRLHGRITDLSAQLKALKDNGNL